MLFGWQRGFVLDFSFALHCGLLKYNKVVTFYLTCLQLMSVVFKKRVAQLVVEVHSYVDLLEMNVHRSESARKNAVLIRSVAGKNQTKCVF